MGYVHGKSHGNRSLERTGRGTRDHEIESVETSAHDSGLLNACL
jgi:hypothetical protein